MLDDLEGKLCEDLPSEKASQISVEGTEALQLDGFGCSVFDISSRRTKDRNGTWKLELASSPDSTMGADSVGGTELECQYEQNPGLDIFYVLGKILKQHDLSAKENINELHNLFTVAFVRNWSSLVSVSNYSIHTTPTVPSSAESELFRSLSVLVL